MQFEFKIPYPSHKAGKAAWNKRFGLNAYYAGKHWSQRREDAIFWHQLTNAALTAAGFREKPFGRPVVLTFWFNDRLDCSNHAAMAKMIEDALKERVIQDDSRRFVKGIELYFHAEDCIKIQIREVSER